MTLDQISAYLLFHLTIDSFFFMEMARRSKQKIVRKLPEQDFGGGGGAGGGGEDRKMFLMSIQTLAMKKNADCSTSSFFCLAVIGIKYYQSIDFSDR